MDLSRVGAKVLVTFSSTVCFSTGRIDVSPILVSLLVFAR